MEQQTISITKAGIQATLAARTSILAAANPAGGRYDRSKPLHYNVALPPAILSRFDLLHVMVDEPDPAADAAVARHIVATHQARAAADAGGGGVAGGPDGAATPYTTAQLQRFVRYARAHRPRLSRGAAAAIVKGFVRLRAGDAAPGSRTAYRITVRQLEALVRLSEALARARLSGEVSPADVREALRLVRDSVSDVEDAAETLLPEDGDAEDEAAADDVFAPAADAAPAVAALAAAAAALEPARAPQPAGTRVPRAVVERVRDMLVMRLRTLESQGRADATLGGAPVAAASQADLLAWYFTTRAAAGAGTAELDAEAALVPRVVQHLVRSHQALVVVEQPVRGPGEGDAEYAARVRAERLLGVNPNCGGE